MDEKFKKNKMSNLQTTLGIWTDERLSCAKHAEEKKLKAKLSFFNRNCIPLTRRQQLVEATLLSVLDYSDTINMRCIVAENFECSHFIHLSDLSQEMDKGPSLGFLEESWIEASGGNIIVFYSCTRRFVMSFEIIYQC